MKKFIKRHIDNYLAVYLKKYIEEYTQDLNNKQKLTRYIMEGLLNVDKSSFYSIQTDRTEGKCNEHIINALFSKYEYWVEPLRRGTHLGEWFRQASYSVIPELKYIYTDQKYECVISPKSLLHSPCVISESTVGDYSYGGMFGHISQTDIGKFCSIGPNLLSGWGIHPTKGVSTSPMFYSTRKQNGTSLSETDKIEERKRIKIGNDVFIGANVTILDGVTIGDGAIIGAGAVVSKDIPPYAIAVGCPIRISKYRFSKEIIEKLLQIKWWDFDEDKLVKVEKYFWDIEQFIHECEE